MVLTAEQRASLSFSPENPHKPPNNTPPDVLNGLSAAISSNDERRFNSILASYVGSARCTNIHELNDILLLAVSQDKPYFVTQFLQCGLKVHARFVIKAIEVRAKRCMEAFIAFGWDINENIALAEPSTIHTAFRDEEMTFWMLDHGADLNKDAFIDITPMSLAMMKASPDLIKKLLDRGADVTKGELLQYALEREGDEVFQVVSLLLDKGVSLNTTRYANHYTSSNHFFWMDLGTPLHTAVKKGMVEIVRLFLDRGADATIKNSKGHTAKDLADKAGHVEIARMLASKTGNN